MLLIFIEVGCAVTSDYQPPIVDMPPHWSGQPTNKVHVAQSAIAWWKLFQDAELDSLIARAVAANLDIRLAHARLLEVRTQLRIEAANALPSLTVTASYARERETKNAPSPLLVERDGTIEAPGRADSLFQSGLDASWELDVFGGKRRAIEASRAAVGVAAFERDSVILSVLAEVARTYIELRTTQRMIALATDNIASRNDFVRLVNARYVGGMGSNGDVERAKLLARQATAEVPLLESGYKAQVNRLCTLLGLQPGALASELKSQSAKPAVIPAVLPTVDPGLPSDLLRQRPDILRAERNISVTAARLGVATADLYPRFSLSGTAGLASVSARDFFSAGSLLWKIGPTITWPIFRRGQVVATIEVRNLQQQEALIAYRKTILNALEEADNAIDAYAREKNRHAILVAALNDSNAALAMSRSRYTGGLADFREVLDTGNLTLQAQRELSRGDRDIGLALIWLYKVLGGGWSATNVVMKSDGGFAPAVECGAIAERENQPCFSSP